MKASSSQNVIQKRPASKPRKAPRTMQISVRIDQSVADGKPANLSWGDWLATLTCKATRACPYYPELLRNIVWCAVSTDLLARWVSETLVTGQQSALDQAARSVELDAAARLLAELARIRELLEEVRRAGA